MSIPGSVGSLLEELQAEIDVSFGDLDRKLEPDDCESLVDIVRHCIRVVSAEEDQ